MDQKVVVEAVLTRKDCVAFVALVRPGNNTDQKYFKNDNIL